MFNYFFGTKEREQTVTGSTDTQKGKEKENPKEKEKEPAQLAVTATSPAEPQASDVKVLNTEELQKLSADLNSYIKSLRPIETILFDPIRFELDLMSFPPIEPYVPRIDLTELERRIQRDRIGIDAFFRKLRVGVIGVNMTIPSEEELRSVRTSPKLLAINPDTAQLTVDNLQFALPAELLAYSFSFLFNDIKTLINLKLVCRMFLNILDNNKFLAAFFYAKQDLQGSSFETILQKAIRDTNLELNRAPNRTDYNFRDVIHNHEEAEIHQPGDGTNGFVLRP